MNKVIDLEHCVARVFNHPNRDISLRIIQPSDYDEHYGFQPAQDIEIYSVKNISKLVEGLSEILKAKEQSE